MYQTYYSSSDIQLYFSSTDHTRIIKVDTALSIGYSLRQSSSPIYSLGSRTPQFYSSGNTIGNGTITLAFTDEEYLKYCLDYVATGDTQLFYNNTNLASESGSTLQSSITGTTIPGNYKSTRLNNAQFIAEANASAYRVEDKKRLISIGAIKPLFHIKMYLNNETAIRGSDSKVINLKDVKIISESVSSASTNDAPVLISYSFIFKDVERG
jgi:hypothetical protein